MGNKKNKTKREKRAAREREEAERRAAREAFEARRRKYRVAAAITPLVTLGAAIGVYLWTDDKQLGGLVGLVGVAVFIPLFLGAIGSEVQPRDRVRAGAIDFGNKRR